MSYSTSEKPEALEPERLTQPLRVRTSKKATSRGRFSDVIGGGELTLLKTLYTSF